MPLEKLMEDDAIEEATEAEPEKQPGGTGKLWTVAAACHDNTIAAAIASRDVHPAPVRPTVAILVLMPDSQ
jgi:hypothetical protein